MHLRRGAQLVDEFDHDDAGFDRDSKERKESDRGGNREVGVGKKQRERAADEAMMTETRTSIAHLNERNMV